MNQKATDYREIIRPPEKQNSKGYELPWRA